MPKITKDIDKEEYFIEELGSLTKSKVIVGGKRVDIYDTDVIPNLNFSFEFESYEEKHFVNINRKNGKKAKADFKDNLLKIKVDKETDEWMSTDDDKIKWYITFDEDPRESGGDFVVDFDLKFNQGVNFAKCGIPDFTEQELLDGATVNENSIDSIAVYCNKAWSTDRIKYYSGKMMHIYRRKWINADESFEWLDQEIIPVTDTDAILRVTVPEVVMDGAVYPAILNDTFGVTSYGSNSSTSATPGDGAYIWYIGQAPEDGDVTDVVISDNDVTSTSGYALFYKDTVEGEPPDFVAMSSEQTWSGDGDHSSAVSGAFSSGEYLYTGMQHDTTSSMKVYFDSVSWYYDYTTTNSTYGSPPSPTWSSSLSTDRKYTTWIVYTPSGGGGGSRRSGIVGIVNNFYRRHL